MGDTDIPLVPAVQLDDNELINRALEVLRNHGIHASSIPVERFTPTAMPGWALPAAGGWFLLVDHSRLEDAMLKLEDLMGEHGGEH